MKKIEYTIVKSNIKHTYIQIKNGEVIVKAPKRMSNKSIKEIVENQKNWIEKKLQEEKKMQLELLTPVTQEETQYLKKIVEKSIETYSKNIGEKPNKVTIKKMKYAWGSCTSKRNIAINLMLAKKPKELIEYVVLHEICHLKYMNHSKDFWNLVNENMENYKEYRKRLKMT